MDPSRIRNFCIIAHIDHGKSTLADRFLELTGAIEPGRERSQFLDSMDLERERGITIKAQAVRLAYERDGDSYELNLIDTPGHVDFNYEVSRSLAACEGAVLLVDAAQGVEAQTIGNLHLAEASGLVIIPVINKIDLPSAEPERVRDEVVDILGVNPSEVFFCSSKTGAGVPEILEAVIRLVPPPSPGSDERLRALVFDSSYDQYRGVVTLVRVVSGRLETGMEISMMAAGSRAYAESVGYLDPGMMPADSLTAGEVGFVATGMKDISKLPVGDTLTTCLDGASDRLPGYREPKPVVFAGLFPIDNSDYQSLRDALAKLRLNDSSFTYDPETSQALGFGFRCGFLGLLHMEVVRERLEREYGLDLIITPPNVVYRVTDKAGNVTVVKNPSQMPLASTVALVEEPYVSLLLIMPGEVVGPVMELCQKRRVSYKDMVYLSSNRVELSYSMPLAEMVSGFYDQLKSKSRGYASLDYELEEYRAGPLVKLEIMVHGEVVDAFSTVVSRDRAQARGRELAAKLKSVIPRQLFELAIQASVGGRVIARETLPAHRKDVTAKCYGGDITRKRKLREKQKAGKKRMKMVGQVEIPQEAFIAIIKAEDGA
ncbi:MAG: elongation factor 4 [Candidatus Anoxymicrobium japonicum]|uniref:Elongation factor 4 n=1 Tax=Candidatus Anoxymicrobium japonicum TaxID=2013648 RepID=A0A2N3G7C4_9ACTN|nr:MAG: elongation factor 4 [Candidatus Anoxymicrobium japonicum]